MAATTGRITGMRIDEGSEGRPDALVVTVEGRRASGEQRLVLTDKAMFRMAHFFSFFGVYEADFTIDHETGAFMDPDLTGEAVLFEERGGGAVEVVGRA